MALLLLLRLSAVCLALAAVAAEGEAPAPGVDDGYDSTQWVIKDESKVYQMGMFPYLYGGGANNIVVSREKCEEMCLLDKDCNFGTYVTQGKGALELATHSFSKLVRYGECWLSKSTHTTQVECGVECESFSKQAKPEPEESTAAPTTTTTTAYDDRFDPAKHYVHRPCTCDPNKHPSMFTKCQQDPYSYHIIVKHLQPRFHTVPYNGGEQHKCRMTSATKCKCCDCRDDGSTFDIKTIGFGIHTAKAPFLAGGGAANVVSTFEECRKLCHEDPKCNAGTFISAGSSEGQCWMSSYTEPQAPCEKPCQSFVKTTKLGVKGYEPEPEFLPLQGCQGDCDHDGHCPPKYSCHQQDGRSPIPGCEGMPEEAMDYCVLDTDRAEHERREALLSHADILEHYGHPVPGTRR